MSYDLRTAIETGLRLHPAAATQDARVQAARTGIEASGVQYRPYLEGHASVGKTLAGDRNIAFRDEVSTRTPSTDPFYTSSLGLVVPLVREGRLPFLMALPAEELARARYEAQRQARQATRGEIVARVASAFFAALLAREDARTQEQVVEATRLLAEDARLGWEQHLVSGVELALADAALGAARAEREAARAASAGSLATLLLSMGYPPQARTPADVHLVDDEPPPPAVRSLEEALADAGRRHPAILVQAARVAEARAALRLQATERYPTVEATTTVGVLDDFSSSPDRWSVRSLLRMNWRIFDFGAIDLKLRQQEEVVRAEEQALVEARREVDAAVTAAWHDTARSRARLGATETALDAAAEQRRAAAERVDQQTAPRAELLRAELGLLAARRALAQARYALRLDEIRLGRALGLE